MQKRFRQSSKIPILVTKVIFARRNSGYHRISLLFLKRKAQTNFCNHECHDRQETWVCFAFPKIILVSLKSKCNHTYACAMQQMNSYKDCTYWIWYNKYYYLHVLTNLGKNCDDCWEHYISNNNIFFGYPQMMLHSVKVIVSQKRKHYNSEFKYVIRIYWHATVHVKPVQKHKLK